MYNYYIDKKTFLELLNKIDALAKKTKRNFNFDGGCVRVSCLPFNVHLAAVALGWFLDGKDYQSDKNRYVQIEYKIDEFIYNKIAGFGSNSAYSGFDISAFIISRIFARYCTYQDKGDNRYYTFFSPSNNQILKIY